MTRDVDDFVHGTAVEGRFDGLVVDITVNGEGCWDGRMLTTAQIREQLDRLEESSRRKKKTLWLAE